MAEIEAQDTTLLDEMAEAEQARVYNQRVESEQRSREIINNLGRLDELNKTLYDNILASVKRKTPDVDPDALIRDFLNMEQNRALLQEEAEQQAAEQAAIDQGFAESEARTEGVVDPQTQLLPSFSSKKKSKKAAQAVQEAVSKVDELLNPGQTIDDVPDSQFEVNSFTAEEHQDLIDFINGVFPQFTFEGATAAMTEDGQVGSFFTNSEGRQTFMPGEDSFAAEGFVLSGKDKIYMTRRMTRPDGSLITDPKEAVNRFVEVAFHEGIGHFGLRKMFDAGTQLVDKDGKEVESKRFTGEKYNRIIDGFYKKNKKEIDAWPEYENEPVFRRTEEFIARKFGETGAGADLNIADKLEVAIRNALPVLRDRIGAAQMAKIIKDVQAEYLNAPEGKSIVTGDPLAGAAKQGSAELTEDENAQLLTLRARKRQREVEKLRSLDPKTQQNVQSKKRSELSKKIRDLSETDREKVIAFFNRNPDAERTDAQIQKVLQRGVKGTKNKKKGVPLKVPAEKKVTAKKPKTKKVEPKTAGQEVKKLTKKQSDAEVQRIADASFSRRDSDYDRFRSFGGKTPLRRYESGRSDKKTAFGAKFDVDKELGLALRTKSWPMALVQDLINFDRLNPDYAKGLRASLNDDKLGKAEKKLANLILARGRDGYVKQKKAQLTKDQKRGLTAAPSGFEKNGSKWEGLGKPEMEVVTNAKRINMMGTGEGVSFSRRYRNPILVDANTRLRSGKISAKEHQKILDTVPIIPMESVPDLPVYNEMINALQKTGKGKAEKGILGFKGKSMDDFDGTMVGARLDIAAYNKYGVYVVTLHDKPQGGEVLVYSQTALLEDIQFSGSPDAALNIGIDKDKTTIARMWGRFKKHDSKKLADRAKKIMEGKEKGWQQVGMNPDRGSYFYLMDGTPLLGAKEIIQIGKLVLAKGAQTTTRMDPTFKLKGKGTSALIQEGATFSVRGNEPNGTVYDEGVIDAKSADALGATFSLSKADVVKLKNKRFIKFVSDRMATGKYRPRDPNNKHFTDSDQDGVYYMMMGGMGYPTLKENLAKGVVWASDDPREKVGINDRIIGIVRKFEETNGKEGANHVIVTLSNPKTNVGNGQFWEIYWRETQGDLDNGSLDRKKLNDRIAELIKSPAVNKGDKPLAQLMAQAGGKDNWEKLKDIGRQLTFENRTPLVIMLGGDIFEAKNPTNYGAPLSEIHSKTIVYPEAQLGDAVGILKLAPSKTQKRDKTALDAGVPVHAAYDYVLMGEPIAMIAENPIPIDQFAEGWLDLVTSGAKAEIKKLKSKSRKLIKERDALDPKADAKKITKLGTQIKNIANDINVENAKTKSTLDRVNNKKFFDRTYRRFSMSPIPFNIDENLISQFEYPATPTTFSRRKAAATHSLNTPTPGAGGIRGGLLRLVKKIEPLQNIKKRDEYLKMRAKLLGKLDRWQDMGRTVYDALVDSKNTKAIYDYLTTKGASSSMIPDADERRAAESAKATIRQLGQALVDRNLLKQETQEKFKDAYLPRVYLQYLLNEEDRNTIAAGRALKPSAMNYLKQRKDIPKGIRELILGEITDQEGAPAYLASRTILQQGRDISIIDWLGQLATTSMANGWDWVIPESVVSFNTLEEIKKAAQKNKANANQLIKDLDLGRDLSQYYADVTPFWLQQEAERLRTQIAPTMDGAKKAVVNDLAAAMEKAGIAGAQTADQVIATGDYKQIPKSRRYGMMAGMVVHKEIADDILGAQNIVTADDSLLDQVIGNGGKLDKFVNYWKWSKVAANPPAWARNMISNMILLNLSGVPLVRMPDLVFSTLRDFSNQGKYYQIAKDQGLVSGNMSSAELGRVEREFNDLMRKMNKDKKGTPMKVFGALKGAFEKVQEGTSDIYSGLETFGKMMAIKYAMETGVKEGGIMSKRVKLDAADAAQYANKWLFDYGLVRPSVRTARNKLVPFLTFQAKALPLMAEVALTRPWAFAPYFALGYGMIGLFKSMFDLEDEEYESMKLGLQDWLREKSTPPELFGVPLLPPNAIPLPYLDQNNKVQFQDISYLFPWGLFSEVISEIGQGKFADAFKSVGLMGGPVFSVTTAISTGIDPFTRKEIVDPLGTGTEKTADVLKYVYNMVAPQPLHWDSGAFKRFAQGITEEIDPKTGEVKITMPQAFGRLAGQNVYSINLQESRRSNMRRLEYEMANLVRKMNRELKGLRKQKKPVSEINELRDEYLERLEKLREEYKEYGQTSKIPAQLRRAG